MSNFLWIVLGVPISTAVCLLVALGRRQFDVVKGGVPVLAGTSVLFLVCLGLFG